MPITQARMLDVLNAADEYRDRWRDLRVAVNLALEQVAKGELDAGSALHGLASYMQANQPSGESAATLEMERRHFKKVFHRNDRERQRMAAYRAEVRESVANAKLDMAQGKPVRLSRSLGHGLAGPEVASAFAQVAQGPEVLVQPRVPMTRPIEAGVVQKLANGDEVVIEPDTDGGKAGGLDI